MSQSALLLARSAYHRILDVRERAGAAMGGVAAGALRQLYERSDRRPWRLGYVQYRMAVLQRILADEALLGRFASGARLPEGHGYRLDARVIEIPWALARVARLAPGAQVLDAGSSLNYGPVVSAAPLAGKHLFIATLAPERRCFWRRGVSYLYGDLRDLTIRTGSMDAVICISTIEHIGMDNERYGEELGGAPRRDKTDFLRVVHELKRVLKPGRSLLISFPFGRYEDHGWFQQFDAAHADELIAAFAPARVGEFVYQYSADGWHLSERAACAACEFFDVQASRYFDRSSKLDFPPHYPAGESAVMCLELVKGHDGHGD